MNIAEYFMRRWEPINQRLLATPPGEVYVSDGFIYGMDQTWNPFTCTENPYKISEKQIEYLKKILRYTKDRKIPILLIISPLPKEYLNCAVNHREVSKRFEEIAGSFGARYYDFNDFMLLDNAKHFQGFRHLNLAGVKVFNEKLADILKKDYPELFARIS